MKYTLKTIYQNNHFLIVDKPAGLVVHQDDNDTHDETLVDLVKGLVDPNLDRAGIVHRLDKDTSGLLIVAKNQTSLEYLKSQFKQRKVKKKYICLVKGSLPKLKVEIDYPIGRDRKNPLKRMARPDGKPAFTSLEVLTEFNNYSLIACYPKTGRTHQIRIHLSKLGNPIVGDTLYGGKDDMLTTRHFLHASKLEFDFVDGEAYTFESELPNDLEIIIEKLSELE